MAFPCSELVNLGSYFYVNDDHSNVNDYHRNADDVHGNEKEQGTKKALKEQINDTVNVHDLTETVAIKQSLLDQIDIKNKALYEENEQLKKDKDSLEKEKDELLSRLSKLAGQKLTKGNPQITDLSDPNRPAKIVERWGSLYTDEWTDAYEDIVKNQKNGNELPEKRLLDIVDWCYKKCSGIIENQEKAIKEKLWEVVQQIHLLGKETDVPVKNKPVHCGCQENTTLLQSMDTFLEIAAIQRQNSPCLNDSVKNKCLEDYCVTNPTASKSEKIFVEKCSDICCVMRRSDPPMVIEYDNFEGQVLDTGKFNKYNRTGTTVEFIVWPVLLLYENGPVLAKGTAQTNDNSKINEDNVMLDKHTESVLEKAYVNAADASNQGLTESGHLHADTEKQALNEFQKQEKEDTNDECPFEHGHLIQERKECTDKNSNNSSFNGDNDIEPRNEPNLTCELLNQEESCDKNLVTERLVNSQTGLDHFKNIKDRTSDDHSNEKYDPNFTSSQFQQYQRRASVTQSEKFHTDTVDIKPVEQAADTLDVDSDTEHSPEKGNTCSAEGENVQRTENLVVHQKDTIANVNANSSGSNRK